MANRFFKLFICVYIIVLSFGYAQETSLTNIIPLPKTIKKGKGHFELQTEIEVYGNDSGAIKQVLFYSNKITYAIKNTEDRFKIKFVISSNLNNKKNQLVIIRNNVNKAVSKEHHTLTITPNSIRIESGTEAGVFYAMSSLSQLIESSVDGKLNCTEIVDEPQFPWRGMHLDVSRHFFSVEEVKKYIDLLSYYKINTFHWHLTDDQGWRIEIKKYPKLCSVGSKRSGTMVGPYKNQQYDSLEYRGFYTQEQIRNIVEYAQVRHVTIVPEIEMPGHALAALSAYPQFSCTKGPFTVAKGWGVFDDVFCAGNDSTFNFLETILSEVIGLFPGKYIHIGGDECPKTRWKSCSACQNRITNEKLKNEHELQSYFIQRIEKYCNKLGKSIIGWDEILEGGLAPNAAVMSWRGEKGGLEAATQKHEVVMCPGKPCYFDHYQATPTEKEPLAIGGMNTLKDVYEYYPIPKDLEKDNVKYILGAQGNVWTEYILNFSQVEYMSVPRMIALAEALWSTKETKNYNHFIQRLTNHSNYLERKKINYCPHFKSK